MALKDKVVNLVIRGKNLFSGTAAEAEDSLDSLGSSTRELKAELDKLENTQKIVKGFGDQKRAVAEAEKAYQSGTQAVADMAREFKKSERAGAGLNRSWNAAKTAVTENTAALSKQQQALQAAGKAQNQAERELAKLNTAYANGNIDAQRYADSLSKAERQLNSAKKTHDANRQAVEQSRQANKDAAAEVKTLGAAIKQNERETKKLATQFERSKKSAAGAKSEFQKQRVALEQSRRSISAMGGSTNKLSQAQQKLNARQKQLRAAMDKSRAAAAKQAASIKDVGNASERSEGKLRNFARTAVASVAGFVGLRAIGAQIREMFIVGDKFERLETQVTALMGSIEGGKEATAWIKEFARDTPLQLEEVTSIFVKLKAFGLDPMNGSMQSVIDQAYKLGGSFQEVEGIALALGQAWAKQKLQGEEILQLIERGVPVWDLLAKVTGKNTAELQNMVSAGELGRDTIKALMDEMGAQSTGAAAAGMSQLSGLISNAKDNLADFYNDIATSGSIDWLKGQLTALNAEFKAMSEDGRMKKLAQDISTWLIKAGEAIKSTVVTIYEWREAIFNVAKAWAALKILGMIRDVGKLAGDLRTQLVGALALTDKGIKAATASARMLFGALFAIPGVGWGAAVIAGLGAVTAIGYKAATSIGELNRQIEAGANAEAKQRKYWRETIKQNEAIAESTRDYRDLQILTAEQVAQLDEKEQQAYKQKLKLHREYLASQVMIKAGYEQVGNAAIASHIDVTKSLKTMHQAEKDLAEGIKLGADRISRNMNPAIREMADEFTRAVGEGTRADQALSNVFKNTDLTTNKGLEQIAGTLKELKKTAQITGEDISRYLGGALSKLSSQELMNLKRDAQATFFAMGAGAAESARVVEAVTGEAYRRLGVSVNEVRTGISDTDQQIIGSFRLIASDANATAKELEASFIAAFNRVSSENGLGMLQEMWIKMAEQGRISADVSVQQLDKIGQKMVEAKLKAADIGTGFAQSKDGVQELIDSIYKMADSSQFSAEQIQQFLGDALDRLSGEDLVRFKAAFIDTFNAGEIHALKLAGVVEDVTTAAFKRLGLSLQEIRTGIDETGADVLAAFNVIASDANATSTEIAAAFKAAAGRLDTEKELALLRDAFIKAAKQSKMASGEMVRGLAWIDEKAAQTAEQVAAIGDGYDTAAEAAEKSADRQMKAQRDVQGEIEQTSKAMGKTNPSRRGSDSKSRKESLREAMIAVGEEQAERQQAALERRNELLGGSRGGEVVTLRFEGPNGGTELSGTKEQVDRMISILKQQGLRTS